MDLAKIEFCSPQNPNIFSHKILVPDPLSLTDRIRRQH